MTRPSLQAATRRQQRHATRRTSHAPQAAHLVGNAIFLLLGVSVFGLVAALSVALTHLPASAASRSATSLGAPASMQTSASARQLVWIPLRSTAPADLIAAAQQSALFAQNRSGSGDHVTDLTHLGTPVFVRPLRRETAAHTILPDFYVLPILNAQGETTDAAELELNSTHTAIHVIALVTYAQPHSMATIPQVTEQAAVAAVEAQHHVHLQNGMQAQLVYFPLDAQQQQTGKLVWKSGGEFPADPVWLVPGSDGQDHLAGTDGTVYYSSQIPRI